MKKTLLFLILGGILMAQEVTIPDDLSYNETFSGELSQIIKDAGLDGTYDVGEDGTEQISFAVIDITNGKSDLGGVNFDNFIYPASVYKMYAGAALLKKCYQGENSLYENYITTFPNVVDKTREIKNDPRPLLQDGDTVTVHYLLDLMITRSDNTAANCVIDLANRDFINDMMHEYNWYGSEVTRKYLSRKYEDPGYEKIRGTETCALHAADFMYKIANNGLVNPWVSQQMKVLLGGQLDKSKLASGLPKEAVMYHKTGWWSYWTNDVGIVDDGKIQYVIALFTPITEEEVLTKFAEVSKKVYELILSRNSK